MKCLLLVQVYLKFTTWIWICKNIKILKINLYTMLVYPPSTPEKCLLKQRIQ